MKKMLVFSNQAKLVAFLISWKKYNMKVNFSDKTLYGELSETELDIACAEFGATVRMIDENEKDSQIPDQ
jgi:hypothetical protein